MFNVDTIGVDGGWRMIRCIKAPTLVANPMAIFTTADMPMPRKPRLSIDIDRGDLWLLTPMLSGGYLVYMGIGPGASVWAAIFTPSCVDDKNAPKNCPQERQRAVRKSAQNECAICN